LTNSDLEELLDEARKNVQTSEFVKEVELLIKLYDRKNLPGTVKRGISHWSFIEMLTPFQSHIPTATVVHHEIGPAEEFSSGGDEK
jgi:hypothetical protein